MFTASAPITVTTGQRRAVSGILPRAPSFCKMRGSRVPIDFRVGGVDCRIGIHFLAFSVVGIPEWIEEWDLCFPAYTQGCGTKNHHKSYIYRIAGMFRRECARGKSKNYNIEMEIPGAFFDEGNSLDEFFEDVYKRGGMIKISGVDIAFDYFGHISRHDPWISPRYPNLQKTYNCPPVYGCPDEWQGYYFGIKNKSPRYVTVYDRIRKYGIPADSEFQGREDWWRCEINFRKDAARRYFPEGHWYMSDIERVGALAHQDDRTFACGPFPDMARFAASGKVAVRQRVQVSFEASRDKLFVDIAARVRRIRRLFALNDGSDKSVQRLDELARLAHEAIYFRSAENHQSAKYHD